LVSGNSESHAGAREIVRRCLGLEPGQQLVILSDETTVEVAIAIAEAAESLYVPHTAILVPVSVQRRIPLLSDLSLLAQGAVREARAILVCANDAPDCLPFRQWFLETHWTARTRIGHMPGASLEVLKLAEVDCDKLVQDCHDLEVALARGHTLELVTRTPGGKTHRLEADIGGWQRLPVASDGIIIDGAWGNVPSGETFIAPLEGTATGSVVVNGSVPGLVVGPGQEIVLYFQRGRLARMEPEESPVARHLAETQIRHAKSVGDLDWANLAEVGVGLNPAVERLTGNMLLDEKMAGTAHVALGSSLFLGGTVQASIHCDLVVRRPGLLVDGKTVVEGGNLAYSEAHWHEHYKHVSPATSPWFAAGQVARSGIQVATSADGRLQRLLRSQPGRVSACFVGEPKTALLAQTLYEHLPVGGEWVAIDRLASRAGLSAGVARRVLHIMADYELVMSR
jgi:leucyl aminopeptidase (aminopeptidase T)